MEGSVKSVPTATDNSIRQVAGKSQEKFSAVDNTLNSKENGSNGISLSESVIEYMSANGYDVDALFEKATKKFKYYTLEHRSGINNSSLSVANLADAIRPMGDYIQSALRIDYIPNPSGLNKKSSFC